MRRFKFFGFVFEEPLVIQRITTMHEQSKSKQWFLRKVAMECTLTVNTETSYGKFWFGTYYVEGPRMDWEI
jgi:hypothetical protein